MPSVKDIMTKNVITIGVNKTVFEAAELMTSKGIGCLVIVDNDVPVGMVTERDFLRRIVAKRVSLDTKISEIMSKSLITVDPEASVKEAARLMATNKIRRLASCQAKQARWHNCCLRFCSANGKKVNKRGNSGGDRPLPSGSTILNKTHAEFIFCNLFCAHLPKLYNIAKRFGR